MRVCVCACVCVCVCFVFGLSLSCARINALKQREREIILKVIYDCYHTQYIFAIIDGSIHYALGINVYERSTSGLNPERR